MSDHIPDVTKMIGETPRTDQQNDDLLNSDSYTSWLEISGFARQLERELNAANERIKRLEEDSQRLNWLLKRGLAWRDCYNDWWKEGEWLYASQSALETIDKAKEAKP